jgi:hypothetical protein
LSPNFFARIKQNEKESNVDNLCTDKFPQGTSNQKDTMDAIESHFKEAFSDKEPIVNVPPDWWDGLPKISNSLREKLDAPLTLNDYTTALFHDMTLGKAPGWEVMASQLHFTESFGTC